MPDHLTKREKEGIVIIVVNERAKRLTCDDDADSNHINCNDYNLFYLFYFFIILFLFLCKILN
jgi:hypothetical protein